jgi:hypothetical protein
MPFLRQRGRFRAMPLLGEFREPSADDDARSNAVKWGADGAGRWRCQSEVGYGPPVPFLRQRGEFRAMPLHGEFRELHSDDACEGAPRKGPEN